MRSLGNKQTLGFKRAENGWSPESGAAGGETWGNLARDGQSAWNAAERKNDERMLNASRQQNKIVLGLLYGSDVGLAQKNPVVGPAERQRVLAGLADEKIGLKEERDLLTAIADPVALADRAGRGGVGAVFEENLAGRERPMRILAAMTGVGFNGYQQARGGQLEKFLQKYPLPMDFEAESANFLRGVRQASEGEYENYAAAMDYFKRAVYGKRQEYWDQMKVLNAQAARMAESKAAIRANGAMESKAAMMTHGAVFQGNMGVPRFESGGMPVRDNIIRPEAFVRSAEQEPEVEFGRVTSAERKKMLRRAKVDGDEWICNGRKYSLKRNMLAQAGVAPEYKMNIEGVQMGFSKVFKMGSRDAVLAYVQDGRKMKVRTYYRSNSQGLWRYLPDYVPNGKGDGGLAWYGKGHSEEALTLPMEMQGRLSSIAEAEPAQLRMDPRFLFAGTAKRYPSIEAYKMALVQGRMRGDFYKEVAPRASIEMGQIDGHKEMPESLDLVGGQEPMFGRGKHFEMRNQMYGQVGVDCYNSRDGRLKYMFCRDRRGRAWIGSVQTRSRISSTGCRTKWVSAGDYVTPLKEYSVMADGYGGAKAEGSYVSMWEKYLSKMPVIRKYLYSLGAQRVV